MTLDELLAREAIRHTLASYNIAGDRGRLDDLASQFTQDAILELPDGSIHNGRDAIKACISGVGSSPRQLSRPAFKFVRHHISTCQIEFPEATIATVRTYFAVFTDIGPDHCGYYADSFRKEGDRWLIAHRKARLDWSSPGSLMGS